MQYLRYLFNSHPLIVGRLIYFISSFIYAYCFAFFLYIINKLFKLSIKPNWFIIPAIFLLFVSFLLGAVTFKSFFRYCLDGSISDIYFLDNGKQTRMIVWYTRVDEGYARDYYSNRLKSFDLKSGKNINSFNLNYYYKRNDCEIFGFYEDRYYAWEYSEQKGVQLLDLYDLKVISNNDQIKKLNPQLGDSYKLTSGKAFNKKDHSLLLINNQGDFIYIFPDYERKHESDHVKEILPETDNSLKNIIDIKKYFKHKKARIYTIFKQGNEAFVFVTMKGFSLSALRIDPKTNEVFERIDYF